MTGAVGVVAEFNPFHNGHGYLLRSVRSAFPDKAVVVVMSGNFVQRGEPAIIGKFRRAEAALRLGADAVIELPAVFVLSSAEFFARAAVGILSATGVVDTIAFGSETGDAARVTAAAEAAIDAENAPGFHKRLKAALKSGITYASAYSGAVGAEMPGPGAPNDMLAVEYIKASRRLGAGLNAFAVKREAHAHASDIRALLLSNNPNREPLSRLLPEESLAAISAAPALGYIENFAGAVRYALAASEARGDLERRLAAAARMFGSVAEITAYAKTRNYSLSAVKRAVCRILLGIREETARETAPGYIRVLGFRNEKKQLIGQIAGLASKPLIVGLKGAGARLSPEGFSQLRAEMFAADIYGMFAGGASGPNAERRERVIVV